MSHPTLPYLQYLRSTVAGFSGALGGDAAAAKQIGVTSRLLDHMAVQRELGPALKAQAYAALGDKLPAIEAVLGPLDALRAACAAADPYAFDDWLGQVGELQRRLVAAGTPQASALCRAVTGIEAEFSRAFEAAVQARTAAAAAQGAGSAARNAKVYDEAALLDFIRRSRPDEAAATIAHSGFISGGFSKYTVGITLANTASLPAEIILRGDASATFGGASVVDEYRLIEVLHAHGVSLPAPLGIEPTGAVFGAPFMLVARHPGSIIGGPFTLPGALPAVGEDTAIKLAAIHRVPLAALEGKLGQDTGRSSDKVQAWLDEGLAAWRQMPVRSPVFETAFEWLQRHVAINDAAPRALVHGDYGLHNLLIHEGRVSTILDWEFAHIGNPAYDLGYFYHQADSLSGWDAFLQAYVRAGAPAPDPQQLDYHLVFATTRIGVMLAQAIHAFTSGAEPGLAGAALIGSNYYEQQIKRMAWALDRVI